jgi:hypothetical protein
LSPVFTLSNVKEEEFMMKRLIRYSLLLFTLMSCYTFCFAQENKQPSETSPSPASTAAEYNPGSWKEHISPEGRFSISFPGVPTELTQPLPLPNVNIVAHTFYLRTLAEYQVTYADYPFPIEGTDKITAFFNGVRDFGIKAIDGHLLEEKEIFSMGIRDASTWLVTVTITF